MTLATHLTLLFAAGLVIVGLTLVGAAVRAYAASEREEMIYLALGFTLIVAAAMATAIGAILTDFSDVQTLLLVNNAFTMGGFLFVLNSVISS